MLIHAPGPDECPQLDDPAETLIGRRSAPRLAVRAPARFRLGDGVADVIIVDISGTGARLHAPYPPPAGRDGVLSWEGIDCASRVVWSRKDSFGIAFEDAGEAFQALVSLASKPRPEPTVAIPLPIGDRSQPSTVEVHLTPRPRIEHPAEVRQGDTWVKVVLKGISQRGFEVGWFPRCKEQAPISLRGPGLPLLHGRVVASDRLVVRCKLREPLHDAVLQHISARIGCGV